VWFDGVDDSVLFPTITSNIPKRIDVSFYLTAPITYASSPRCVIAFNNSAPDSLSLGATTGLHTNEVIRMVFGAYSAVVLSSTLTIPAGTNTLSLLVSTNSVFTLNGTELSTVTAGTCTTMNAASVGLRYGSSYPFLGGISSVVVTK
jgi:hypothetical protein